ncbi:MAG: hypothetical protein KF781_03755 [Chitinophagaceae bacterium]|nr:hypothetical protein [Chitinophagaceae bacterium]MCW5904801.1 hypothetical protein [Chitinophagaceae bacterium]
MKKFLQKIYYWEQWNFYVIYTPLILVWLYYCIRARHFWFFSNVNPTLQFSGLEGETKKEMFEQLPKEAYPTTIYIQPKENFDNILQQMQQVNLQFPVAVKPDIGTKGLCFRKIDNAEELKKYHNTVPFVYLIQTMIELPLEMSVFYVRYPDTTKGKITGITAKEYLQVKGNGKNTLLQLIQAHPKAKNRLEELSTKHIENWQKIIAKDEPYFLSIAGNHNRGATFKNLHNEIDEQLTKVFDDISNYTKHFYYGRFDIKTTSLQDLRQGKNIQILEFNGTGAEPNHIYDCNMSYFNALKTIATHWKYLFEIGRINYKKGIPYTSFKQGRKFLKDAFAAYSILEKYDVDC